MQYCSKHPTRYSHVAYVCREIHTFFVVSEDRSVAPELPLLLVKRRRSAGEWLFGSTHRLCGRPRRRFQSTLHENLLREVDLQLQGLMSCGKGWQAGHVAENTRRCSFTIFILFVVNVIKSRKWQQKIPVYTTTIMATTIQLWSARAGVIGLPTCQAWLPDTWASWSGVQVVMMMFYFTSLP